LVFGALVFLAWAAKRKAWPFGPSLAGDATPG
jgi:hypothetical protein